MIGKFIYLKSRLLLALMGAKATGTVGQNANADGGIKETVDTVVSYVPWLGAGILIFGIINIVLSFMKDEQDPNAVTKGMRYIIAGGLLIAFGVLWSAISGAFGL